MEAERLGQLEVNGSYKNEYLESQKITKGKLMSLSYKTVYNGETSFTSVKKYF